MTNKDEEAQIKISRARISLQRNEPFWAYLSLFLKPKEVKEISSMGVDIQGNLYYNPDFVNSLNDNEMIGTIAHELNHIIFLHFLRGEKLNKQISNIAMDISVNEILKDNNFVLPKGVIWSNDKREVKIFNKTIKKCNEKTAEELYYEIYDEAKKQIKQALKKGKVKLVSTGNEGEGIELDEEDLEGYEFEGSTNQGEGKIKNIDNHIRSKGKDGKELSKEEKERLEKEWQERVVEGYTIAKMRGDVPAGIERLIGKLHESKINWKVLLQKFIQNSIPSDFTYAKPNKKSISSGYYLPDTIKERIEIGVLIDTSGSIGTEELSDFLSEVISISRAFREKIKMTLACHETDLNESWIVENGNINKILDTTKIKGGGGTCFNEPYKQFMEKHRDTKLLVWLTDGFGDKIEKKDLKCDVVWVLSKGGSDDLIKDTGKIIKLTR